MYSMVVFYKDNSVAGVINSVPETAKPSTVLKLWLDQQGIASENRKNYSVVWSLNVTEFSAVKNYQRLLKKHAGK